MGTHQKMGVLIVDDSLVSREILRKGLSRSAQIEVVGVAGDPYEAVEKIEALEPDVLTLDINMPKMDGLTFLRKLMAQHPMPVIVISSSANSVFEALEAGAVDFVAKPEISSVSELETFLDEVVSKVKIASKATTQKGKAAEAVKPETLGIRPSKDIHLIAMGASTGGTDALLTVLKTLPENIPGIVIVQHMPPVFTRMYAERLNSQCSLDVKEAKSGDEIKPGSVLVAPGEFQMKVLKDKHRYVVKCTRGEKVSGHCPSVDVLFQSAAETAGEKAVGIILTGMGSDGAKGLLHMRKAGAYTIGQDRNSCVVYGMPMVAFNIGAVAKQLSLERIGPELIRYLQNLMARNGA